MSAARRGERHLTLQHGVWFTRFTVPNADGGRGIRVRRCLHTADVTIARRLRDELMRQEGLTPPART